jgi:hypothetical protein
MGQTMRYLYGAMDGTILDLQWQDMRVEYNKPAPSWVAGALIELTPLKSLPQSGLH